MGIIVPFPPSPASPAPTGVAALACAPWCLDGTGHSEAVDPAERSCRSTVHRVDSPHGGGHGPGPAETTSAGLHLQAEQCPGEPPAYVLGLELGGTEYWVRLRRTDLRVLVTAARTLLSQTAT